MITMEEVQASKLNDEGLTEAEVAACLIGAEHLRNFSPEEIWHNEYDFYIVKLAAENAKTLQQAQRVLKEEWLGTMAFATYADFQLELGEEEEDLLDNLMLAAQEVRAFCGDNDLFLDTSR